MFLKKKYLKVFKILKVLCIQKLFKILNQNIIRILNIFGKPSWTWQHKNSIYWSNQPNKFVGFHFQQGVNLHFCAVEFTVTEQPLIETFFILKFGLLDKLKNLFDIISSQKCQLFTFLRSRWLVIFFSFFLFFFFLSSLHCQHCLETFLDIILKLNM